MVDLEGFLEIKLNKTSRYKFSLKVLLRILSVVIIILVVQIDQCRINRPTLATL